MLRNIYTEHRDRNYSLIDNSGPTFWEDSLVLGVSHFPLYTRECWNLCIYNLFDVMRQCKLYLYQSQRTESPILKPFVCIYLFLKCFQTICAFSVIQMLVFIRIIIKALDNYFRDWYLFCFSFEQHGRSVYFTWLWTILAFTFVNLILMTVLLCLQ